MSYEEQLYDAVKKGDMKTIRYILNIPGINVNWNTTDTNKYPLINVVLLNKNLDSVSKQKIIIKLKQKGANINATDIQGNTPLHLASLNRKDPSIIIFLIKNGAAVNATNIYGNTPLHLAAEASNGEIVSILINRGALINIKNKDGWTPLHFASLHENYGIVKNLLDHGADVTDTTIDPPDQTPVMLVENNNYIRDMLYKKQNEINNLGIDYGGKKIKSRRNRLKKHKKHTKTKKRIYSKRRN